MFFSKKRHPILDLEDKVNNYLEELSAKVLLITHAGRVIMQSDFLKSKPKDWLGGRAIEVGFTGDGFKPFFIYYENDDYYFNAQRGIVGLNEKNPNDYRMEVSQVLLNFLIVQVFKDINKDISGSNLHFYHNKTNTNVIAYIKNLDTWVPIQHSAKESDTAIDRKIKKLNDGDLLIKDVIAIDELSPA